MHTIYKNIFICIWKKATANHSIKNHAEFLEYNHKTKHSTWKVNKQTRGNRIKGGRGILATNTQINLLQKVYHFAISIFNRHWKCSTYTHLDSCMKWSPLLFFYIVVAVLKSWYRICVLFFSHKIKFISFASAIPTMYCRRLC